MDISRTDTHSHSHSFTSTLAELTHRKALHQAMTIISCQHSTTFEHSAAYRNLKSDSRLVSANAAPQGFPLRLLIKNM